MFFSIAIKGKCENKVSYISLLQYDDTYHNLKKIIKYVKNKDIILSKGDVILFVILKDFKYFFFFER